MELSYAHWFPAQKMAEHCRELVTLDGRLAHEYDALARAHAEQADRAGAP